MRALVFTAISLITLSIATSVVLAQGNDPSIAAKHAIGEVKSIDAATKQVTIVAMLTRMWPGIAV